MPQIFLSELQTPTLRPLSARLLRRLTARGERVIFSNGVPDHDIELKRHKARPSPFCEARYQVRIGR